MEIARLVTVKALNQMFSEANASVLHNRACFEQSSIMRVVLVSLTISTGLLQGCLDTSETSLLGCAGFNIDVMLAGCQHLRMCSFRC